MNFKKYAFSLCLLLIGIFSLQADSCNCNCKDNDKAAPTVEKKSVQIATDKSGKPVIMSYLIQGDLKGNKPTIILNDSYLGKNGWNCVMSELAKCFVVIAIDQIGWGDSTKNDPADLEGIGEAEFAAYSFSQLAFFIHSFIEKLNITSPITYVGVDPQGSVGIKYSVRYAQDKYAFSKLVLINNSPQSIVSDDPCQLAYLTVEQATGLTELFAVNPCQALCSLLTTSFTEPKCLDAAKAVLNQATNFSATQPAAIFSKLLLNTYAEDVSSLLVQVPSPVLYLYSVVNNKDLLSRYAQTIVWIGYCSKCPNPTNTNACIPGSLTLPVVDCRFHTLPGKGTLPHRTDWKRVANYIKEFVEECDTDCCVCPVNPDIPVICPVCP